MSDCSGLGVRADTIEDMYPVFCKSLGVARPPPYKDFAQKLKTVMPHRRLDRRRHGEGTFTMYGIPPPQATANVVELPTRRA
jgi:hypothetical protein